MKRIHVVLAKCKYSSMGVVFGCTMKKALAQNPNLLRTLIGLSLTLIVLLSYAVYGATISQLLHLRNRSYGFTVFDDIELTKVVKTTKPRGLEAVAADGQNLTWINVTVDDLAAGAVFKLTNDGKLYSHPFLGVPDAEVEVDGKTVDFRCSEHCTLR